MVIVLSPQCELLVMMIKSPSSSDLASGHRSNLAGQGVVYDDNCDSNSQRDSAAPDVHLEARELVGAIRDLRRLEGRWPLPQVANVVRREHV